MKFNTTKAEFDFNKQVLSGKNKIIGQQNKSTIKAEGFKVFNRENKIIFTGKSSLTLPKSDYVQKSFFFVIFLGLHVLSQQLITQKDNPVEIYAEQGIEWHKNENKYIAIGNAKAKSGTMSVESDRIEAFYNEKDDSAMDIRLVKAHKKVIIKDKKLRIDGGNLAEYNLLKDHFSIFGKTLH